MLIDMSESLWMLTSLPSGAKAGKALLPVLLPVSFSTSALPHSSDPESPSAVHRSGLTPAPFRIQSPTGSSRSLWEPPNRWYSDDKTAGRWQAVHTVIVTESVPDSTEPRH